MIITSLGDAFIKIEAKDYTVAINPKTQIEGKKTPRFGADIALVSSFDKRGIEEHLSYKDKIPFMASGPGEYEIGGIYIKGIKNGENTIYSLFFDGINIVHLGEISGKNPNGLSKELLGNVDILFVPIGGDKSMSPEDAYKIATSFEPKVIIPLLREEKKKDLEKFINEAGMDKFDIMDKFVVKKKDLEGKEGEVIVIKNIVQ